MWQLGEVVSETFSTRKPAFFARTFHSSLVLALCRPTNKYITSIPSIILLSASIPSPAPGRTVSAIRTAFSMVI